MLYHAIKYGYVTIKDAKEEICICEVEDGDKRETVNLPRNELSASIPLVVRIVGNKSIENEND